jgi:DNA-binding PadR family transcriptional regulator
LSTSSKNFDLNSIASDVIAAVRSGFSDFRNPSATRTPDSDAIKVAVLSTVEHDTKNEMQISAAIGVANAGSWAPSSAVIHSTLNELVESKLVAAQVDGDRKTYAITKAGKKALATALENPPTETEATAAKADLTCNASFISAASKLGPVLIDIAQTASSDQKKKAAEILEEARHRLHVILAEK